MRDQAAARTRRVLVTGGAGFVAGHLISRLLAEQTEVTVVDLWPKAARTPLRALGVADRVTYVQGDVRDGAALLTRTGGGYDVVYHLAAQPISPISNLDPDETLSRNVAGTTGAVALVKAGAADALVLASSACAYGVPDPRDCPLREDTPVQGGFYVYTASKQRAEEVVRQAAIPAAIARFVNLFGPADWHCSRLVPRLIRQLLNGEPLTLRRSNGDSVLDFMYVGDAIDALLALGGRARSARSGGEVPLYNFGTAQPVRVREFAASIPPLYDGRSRNVCGAGEASEPPMSKYLSTERATRELGWSPKTPRDAALRETIRWYVDHADALELLEAEILAAPTGFETPVPEEIATSQPAATALTG
jgi:nucleoside-diphosphate-sugar epimerase